MESQEPRLYHAILAAMTPSDKAYLAYMAIRLREMRRILKPTGSIYLHCDPTMSHYLKLLMDAIFGRSNFRNEIVWCYSGWNAKLRHRFISRHDVIFYYSRSRNPTFLSWSEPWESVDAYLRARRQKAHDDEDGRLYILDNAGGGKRIKRYVADAMKYGKPASDVWAVPKINNSSAERTGYPTQKPLALMERIIRASSNLGDLVFDPFCGCATTLVSAWSLSRQWLGIDISPKASELVVERISEQHGSLFQDYVSRTDIPQRTDLGTLPRYNCTENRQTLYGKQAGNCAGCAEHFEIRHLEVDHIIARAKGGTDHIENLQLLCGHCNRTKGDRRMIYLRTKLQIAA